MILKNKTVRKPNRFWDDINNKYYGLRKKKLELEKKERGSTEFNAETEFTDDEPDAQVVNKEKSTIKSINLLHARTVKNDGDGPVYLLTKPKVFDRSTSEKYVPKDIFECFVDSKSHDDKEDKTPDLNLKRSVSNQSILSSKVQLSKERPVMNLQNTRVMVMPSHAFASSSQESMTPNLETFKKVSVSDLHINNSLEANVISQYLEHDMTKSYEEFVGPAKYPSPTITMNFDDCSSDTDVFQENAMPGNYMAPNICNFDPVEDYDHLDQYDDDSKILDRIVCMAEEMDLKELLDFYETYVAEKNDTITGVLEADVIKSIKAVLSKRMILYKNMLRNENLVQNLDSAQLSHSSKPILKHTVLNQFVTLTKTQPINVTPIMNLFDTKAVSKFQENSVFDSAQDVYIPSTNIQVAKTPNDKEQKRKMSYLSKISSRSSTYNRFHK
uniref:Uncharacterized protein n=1 Tax=Acrobeloides nanus TaxID=290746 RepID=A0A914CVY8_9BILA